MQKIVVLGVEGSPESSAVRDNLVYTVKQKTAPHPPAKKGCLPWRCLRKQKTWLWSRNRSEHSNGQEGRKKPTIKHISHTSLEEKGNLKKKWMHVWKATCFILKWLKKTTIYTEKCCSNSTWSKTDIQKQKVQLKLNSRPNSDWTEYNLINSTPHIKEVL